MQDFKKQKFNMIESQLKVADITNPNVLSAYMKVCRENTLPRELQYLAYRDQHFNVDNLRYQIRPVYEAKIIQAADIKKNEIVLIIGAYPGISMLLVSSLASVVIALENSNEKVNKLNSLIVEDNVNIFVRYFSFEQGLDISPLKKDLMDAEIDVIFFFEAIPNKPEAYLKLLNNEGRLIVPILANHNLTEYNQPAKNINLTKVTKFTKRNESIDKQILFEAFLPSFKEFVALDKFSL